MNRFPRVLLRSAATIVITLAAVLVAIWMWNHYERSPWTRRFWESTLRDADSLARRIDYVHFNPVKHGYVTCVAAWPHSSFHAFVARGVLPIDWAGGREGMPAPSGE